MYRSACAPQFAATGEAPDLPPEAPLTMPVQDLRTAPVDARPPLHDPLLGRRMILIGGALAIGMFGAQEMARPMALDGIGLWDAGLTLLFFGLFAWIGFGFLCAVAGFSSLVGRGPGLPRWLARTHRPTRRTAILVPIYNEELGPLFDRLLRMAESVEAAGLAAKFDLFVLSDSRAGAEVDEHAAFRLLRARTALPVYYRRRPANIARKPGNIAEWVRRFGAAYEHMVILDADSLMSGKALARMAATMEADPRIGLLQSIPSIHNARTLFARWQQFCSAAYGPVANAGLIWWSGSEATFWGHNAIVRVRAFAESCGLPELSGREPFGGHIQSHDMFEAALLRRRGWAVHMINLPEGSLEEAPPTLPDLAVRDRRWCQGNLQHLRLLNTAGLHWTSRLQLLIGASAYMTSPMWLLLLIASLIEPFREAMMAWSIAPSGILLAVTLVLLFAPKLFALGWIAIDDDLRSRLGGGGRVFASMLIEIPVSMLIAPITMLTQTLAIIDIVRGRPSGWAPQRRSADGIALRDAWRHYRPHVAVGGIFWIAILGGVGGAIWTLPVAVSLVAAPWVAMAGARVSLGDWLAARGLFLAAGERTGGDLSNPLDFGWGDRISLVAATR